MPDVVEIQGLTKIFVKGRSLRDLLLRPLRPARRITALEGIDLTVRQGEIFGLLGPNGAGKTTLLKMLTGLLVPTRGRARVGGLDVVRSPIPVRSRVGFVTSEERSFYWRLSGRENLHFFGRLCNVPARRLAARCGELLEQVEMSEAADLPFMTYSSGMKQRLALARALLHDPPILIMDEPTRSLDPTAARHLRQFVRGTLNARQGKTVLLATHNLDEAELLCARIAIISRARIRRVGTMAEIRAAESPRDRYQVSLSKGLAGVGDGVRVLEERPEGEVGRRYTLEVDREGAGLTSFLRSALDAGCRVVSCDRMEMPLQEVFDRVVAMEDEGPEAPRGSGSSEGSP